MAGEQFSSQAEQLVSALEARGRSFERLSQAEITLSQLQHPLTRDAIYRLTDLPDLLHLAGEEPLSLAEARAFYQSRILDALCSVLRRLQWTQFCKRLDALGTDGRALTVASRALDCMYELLHAGWRVHSSEDAECARQEAFSRYCTTTKRKNLPAMCMLGRAGEALCEVGCAGS